MDAESRPFSPLLREIFDRMPAGVAVFDRGLNLVEWRASSRRSKNSSPPFAPATASKSMPLRLDIKEVLYRVGQEWLHNTVKHARATHVTVRLSNSNDRYRLETHDNGVGFDTSGEFPGHLGLRSMAERTARDAGTLDIQSSPGTGTRISLEVPAIPGHLPGDPTA